MRPINKGIAPAEKFKQYKDAEPFLEKRIGAIVAAGEAGNYLWPDQDDTFHVFSYEQSIPRLNEAYLTTQDPVVRQRAENLFKLVQLDHVPGCIKDKDRRNKCRMRL